MGSKYENIYILFSKKFCNMHSARKAVYKTTYFGTQCCHFTLLSFHSNRICAYAARIMCNFCKFIFLMRINIYSNQNDFIIETAARAAHTHTQFNDSEIERWRSIVQCAMRLQWVYLRVFNKYALLIRPSSSGNLTAVQVEKGNCDEWQTTATTTTPNNTPRSVCVLCTAYTIK